MRYFRPSVKTFQRYSSRHVISPINRMPDTEVAEQFSILSIQLPHRISACPFLFRMYLVLLLPCLHLCLTDAERYVFNQGPMRRLGGRCCQGRDSKGVSKSLLITALRHLCQYPPELTHPHATGPGDLSACAPAALCLSIEEISLEVPRP